MLEKVEDINKTEKNQSLRISVFMRDAGTVANSTAPILDDAVSYTFYYLSDEPSEPEATFITAQDYPGLAEIWDNDADAIYDNL